MDGSAQDPQLVEDFIEEAAESLASLEQSLLVLESDPARVDAVHRAFRAAHTIKGNSAMLELDEVLELAHALEGALGALRDGRATSSSAITTLLLRATDALRELVVGLRTGDRER